MGVEVGVFPLGMCRGGTGKADKRETETEVRSVEGGLAWKDEG